MDRSGAIDVGAWVEPLESTPARAGRRRPVGVDPRLLRLGVVAAAVVLMVPVALAVRDSGPAEVRSSGPDQPASGPAAGDGPIETTTTVAPASTSSASAAPTTKAVAAGGAGRAERRAVAAMKAPAEPACAGTYTVVAGDYWIRFVDSSGADLDSWLASNRASVDTPLYAGDELCIPEGASAPAPPPETTVAPATTVAPDTTVPPTTAAPTNPPTTAAPPPTTEPPTTQPPPTTEPPPATTVGPPVSPGDAESIIRQIWPDELEERALVIAQRESSLQPDAYNGWCCYGLFQIYFEANRSFLASMGVTAAEQLFDARTNVTVAYAMYQRSGWSPWASTDPG